MGHLEMRITYIANDKVPEWFMPAVQSTKLIAIVKERVEEERAKEDHIPVEVSNTTSREWGSGEGILSAYRSNWRRSI